MQDEKRTLDVAEVKALTGFARSKVYEGARDGSIPGPLWVGRRLRFSRAAIERWLNGEFSPGVAHRSAAHAQ